MAMTQKDWDDLELKIKTDIETQVTNAATGKGKDPGQITAYATKQAADIKANLMEAHEPKPDPPIFEPPFDVTVDVSGVSIQQGGDLTDEELKSLHVKVAPSGV